MSSGNAMATTRLNFPGMVRRLSCDDGMMACVDKARNRGIERFLP